MRTYLSLSWCFKKMLITFSKLGSFNEVMRMIDDIARDLSANKAYAPNTMAKLIELFNYMRYTFIICDVHHPIFAH